MAALIPLQDCSQAPHQNQSKTLKFERGRKEEERDEEGRNEGKGEGGVMNIPQTLTPNLIPTLYSKRKES